MLMEPKILILSSDPAESSVLQQVLGNHASLRMASNLLELETSIHLDEYDAVLCAWSFHRGNWQHAMNGTQQRCPDLPVIIFCGQGGEHEWSEVIEAGGFDLLSAPDANDTVLPTLKHVVVSYEARHNYKTSNLIRTAS